MTATRMAAPSVYVSGLCHSRAHDRCCGSYSGVACTCSCHQEPAEPEVLEQPAPTPVLERGRRAERVEWAVRYPKGHTLYPAGGVNPCADEKHARGVAGAPYAYAADSVVVSRTVVTYTTSWTPA